MRISSVVLLVCCLLAGRSMGQQVDCGSDQVMTKLSRQYPSVQTAVQSHGMHLWQLMRDFRTSRPDRSSQNIVIPVVFHVIHDNGVENINEAQIRDALRILNEDFSAMNNELGSIASAFTGIVDAPGVEFRLAELDPDGYPTTGITRTWSLMTYNGFDFNIQSSLIRWPRDRYLNVWVVKYIPGPLGFAFLPQTTDDPETAIYDGIVVRHNALGTFGTATGKISKVLSHEVGHWLGLLHTFGTAVNGTYQQHCVIGDYVDDTPPTRGNPGHCDTAAVSCGNLDNVQNFMDYSKCPSMFTIGQTEVMLAVLNSNLSDRSTVWKDSSLLTTLIGDSILP